MSASFDPKQGLIVVAARLWSETGDTMARLALDTGATFSLINTGKLASIGCYPDAQAERAQMTTGSGVEDVPWVTIPTIRALGQDRTAFPVICHTLPASTGVDGLLGLDFLRGHRLVVDFRAGTITLE